MKKMAMLKSVDFYYFSPTGGTKKVGEMLANSIAESVNFFDLGDRQLHLESSNGNMAIFALPVFGGRIPAFVADRLRKISGEGKMAVSLVVYGTRAYEDALLELNNLLKSLGFSVVASGAFVAQHSMASEVGTGRPDAQDASDLSDFGNKILQKLNDKIEGEIIVSGNYPYKADFVAPVTPLSLDSCVLCGKCVERCPTNAIVIADSALESDVKKCCLCLACVEVCPISARILPPPMREKIGQMLSKLKEFRRPNEIFI